MYFTSPKPSPKGKQLQIQSSTMPSYLKHDGTTNRVYGRGTGRDAAVANMQPDILPPGNNIIGIGNKHCPVKHKDAMRMPKSMEDKMESMGMEGPEG